ncbi:hypothetical protein H2200_011967 [Cladophialophora chaetospira]|uniref:Uncharacterized protein n=1 Tax=Cladophialophora chaetospira TaxID=386627 RepID=A0AA38WZ26_9EURO|nr:hypothetical protein H2200_011967 [Cladophialophora chaetospira]
MRPRQDDEKTIRPAKSMIMSSPSSSPPEGVNHGLIRSPRQQVITGDFRDLQQLSPPDLSQHPMNQELPLNSTSDAPLMITNTKREEIKKMVKDARRKFDEAERQRQREEAEQAEAERQGTVRFKSFPKRSIAFNTGYNNAVGNQASSFNFEGAMAPKSSTSQPLPPLSYQTPRHASDPVRSLNLRSNFSRLQIDEENEETDIYDILKEGSPTVASTPGQSKRSFDSSKGTNTPASDGFDQKKSGLRKGTGKFSRTKSERSNSELTPPVDHETLHRPDLERYLRSITNNQTYDYDPGQPYPRHPNTSRGWQSRNLKCTSCLDECCAVCGRACCAYRAAVLALRIHRTNPESLKIAEERLMQIAYLFPYGQEVPTFLRCTKGDEIGCGKLVCPDCCGECPNPICKDIQCRKCKKDPWNDCLWHDEDMNRRAF